MTTGQEDPGHDARAGRSSAPGGAEAEPANDTSASGDVARARLEHAREVIRLEARTIARLEERLGPAFLKAVDLLLATRGQIVVTGMGKAGLIGAKLSATFASTGTPSLVLHPSEAQHGDLGRIRAEDVVLILSNSGETTEIVRLLPHVRRIGARVVALTGAPDSTLAREADAVLDIGRIDEACPLGLAPTASTSAMLAMGDALAMVVLKARGFGAEDFARYHPAGSLGRRLMHVRDVMRTGDALPLVSVGTPLKQAIEVMTGVGAAVLVDAQGKLRGIFTDGDFRRLWASGAARHDVSVDAVAIRHPRVIRPDALVGEAEGILREHKLDQLPVVERDGRVVGLLDVQDLLPTRL